MLKQAPIENSAKKYIQDKLSALANEYNIKILLAIESGSRAWGFPSCDSDYDVRFIYTRTAEDYLSIKSSSSTIEVPILEDARLGVPFDLSGWDIRKALLLATGSNAVLLEWLQSPICYIADAAICKEIEYFAKKISHLPTLAYHYDRIARNTWQKIVSAGENVKLKHYCYAIRAVIALSWIRNIKTVPPMDIESLSKSLNGEDLKAKLENIITQKAASKENAVIPRSPAFDGYIESILALKEEKMISIKSNINEADQLFRKIINHL